MPATVLIVEGSFIFFNENVRKNLKIKVYVDADDDVRLSRRLVKYMKNKEQLLKLEEFLEYYYKFAKPGYEEFIEPSKQFADIVLPNYGFDLEGKSKKYTSNFRILFSNGSQSISN